jgi:hypothetical protein
MLLLLTTDALHNNTTLSSVLLMIPVQRTSSSAVGLKLPNTSYSHMDYYSSQSRRHKHLRYYCIQYIGPPRIKIVIVFILRTSHYVGVPSNDERTFFCATNMYLYYVSEEISFLSSYAGP